MNKASWFLSISLLAATSATVGLAQELRITPRALGEAADMINREPYAGSEQTLQAPTALLLLFPEIMKGFSEAQRAMAEHQEARRRPESIQSVVSSHEEDIDVRHLFNVRLRLAEQKVGHLRDKFEGLDEALAEQEEDLELAEKAFRESRKRLKRWSDEGFPYANLWPVWPPELPLEVQDELNGQLERLTELEESAEQAMALARLERTFERLARDHAALRRTERSNIASERSLWKNGALHVFKEIGFQITECLERNEAANETSQRMIDITLGHTSGAEEPQEESPGDPESSASSEGSTHGTKGS